MEVKFQCEPTMGKALECFRNRLEVALQAHGAVGDFCKKVDVSRNAVRGWLNGTPPSLDLLEKAAEAIGLQPWELIKPEGARPTPTSAEALAAAALSSPVLREILGIWSKLDDVGREGLLVAAEDLLRAQPLRKKTPQNGSSSQGAT